MFINYFSVDRMDFSQSKVLDYRLTLSWLFLEAVSNGPKQLICNSFLDNGIHANVSDEGLERYEKLLKSKQPSSMKRQLHLNSYLSSPEKKPRNEYISSLLPSMLNGSPNKALNDPSSSTQYTSGFYENSDRFTVIDECNDNFSNATEDLLTKISTPKLLFTETYPHNKQQQSIITPETLRKSCNSTSFKHVSMTTLNRNLSCNNSNNNYNNNSINNNNKNGPLTTHVKDMNYKVISPNEEDECKITEMEHDPFSPPSVIRETRDYPSPFKLPDLDLDQLNPKKVPKLKPKKDWLPKNNVLSEDNRFKSSTIKTSYPIGDGSEKELEKIEVISIMLNILSRQYLSHSHLNTEGNQIMNELEVKNSISVITKYFSKSRNLNTCYPIQEDCTEYIAHVYDLLTTVSGDKIDKVLHHQLINERQCTICRNHKYSEESMTFSFQLPLSVSVKDSLHQYLNPGNVMEDNVCHKCNQDNCFMQHYKPIEFPETLVLTLNRFDYTNKSTKRKDQCTIDENLMLGDMKYIIRSIIVHIGDHADSGHYYCYCSCPEYYEKEICVMHWYKFSDGAVTKTTKRELLRCSETTQNNYVLFYQQFDKFNKNAKVTLHETSSEFPAPNLPLGINNPGDACYAISVLQSMAFMNDSLCAMLKEDMFFTDNFGKKMPKRSILVKDNNNNQTDEDNNVALSMINSKNQSTDSAVIPKANELKESKEEESISGGMITHSDSQPYSQDVFSTHISLQQSIKENCSPFPFERTDVNVVPNDNSFVKVDHDLQEHRLLTNIEKTLEEKRLKALEKYSHRTQMILPNNVNSVDDNSNDDSIEEGNDIVTKRNNNNHHNVANDQNNKCYPKIYFLREHSKFRNVSYNEYTKSTDGAVVCNIDNVDENTISDDDSNYSQTVGSGWSSQTSCGYYSLEYDSESSASQPLSVTESTKAAQNNFMLKEPMDKTRKTFHNDFTMEKFKKDPLKYCPPMPFVRLLRLEQEFPNIIITADTDSIYFCHHDIAESLNSFHPDNTFFELSNFFLFHKKMPGSRNRIYFTRGYDKYLNEDDGTISRSLSDFPSFHLMTATVGSEFEGRNICITFDIYYSLLKPKSFGHFSLDHEIAFVSGMNMARERLLRSLKVDSFLRNKLFHLDKFRPLRKNNDISDRNLFRYNVFSVKEITRIFGEFEYSLKAISTNEEMLDGTEFYWNHQWSETRYSCKTSCQYEKISLAAMDLLRYGCCSGNSSNLKNKLLMKLRLDSSYMENEKVSKQEDNPSERITKVLESFVSECNKKSEEFVKLNICPNYQEYNVIWSRDIGFNFQCTNKDYCYVVCKKKKLMKYLASWFKDSTSLELNEEYQKSYDNEILDNETNYNNDDNLMDVDDDLSEKEQVETDEWHNTCESTFNSQNTKLRYYGSCYPIFGVNDICNIHFGMTKVRCFLNNVNNKNLDSAFINDSVDANLEPIEHARCINLLNGQQIEGIRLRQEGNKEGVIGFQVYCPSFKSINIVKCKDHQLLNSLMQHLFIVLDEKRYIYKVQYKESIEVLVSKILPMLETILEDTSNELLNLLTLDLRLEFMFSIQETTTIPKLHLEKMLSVAHLESLKEHYLSLSTVLLRPMISFLEQLKLKEENDFRVKYNFSIFMDNEYRTSIYCRAMVIMLLFSNKIQKKYFPPMTQKLYREVSKNNSMDIPCSLRRDCNISDSHFKSSVMYGIQPDILKMKPDESEIELYREAMKVIRKDGGIFRPIALTRIRPPVLIRGLFKSDLKDLHLSNLRSEWDLIKIKELLDTFIGRWLADNNKYDDGE